jgi:hypothetical protein
VKADLDALLADLTSCFGKACRARPALKLRLSFRNGGGCVASGVKVEVAGADAGHVIDVDPGKLGARHLSRNSKNVLSVNATMRDGREVTLTRSAPPAC